jgi:hypothetical protein
MALAELSPQRLLRAHHLLGASTGYMADLRRDWGELTTIAARTSSLVVELSALSEPELVGLLRFLGSRPRLPFRYVSLHAPTEERELPEPELIELLSSLPRSVKTIVTHPDAIEDPAHYRRLGARLALENLDARTPSGATAEGLERWFPVLPQAGLCLDVAHARSVDPTMEVAHEFLNAFPLRLRHVHVSSLDAQHHHVPPLAEHVAAYEPVLARCRDVPWLLEAPAPQP